jgi:cytochrome c5
MSMQLRCCLPTLLALGVCLALGAAGGDRKKPADPARGDGPYPGKPASYKDERATWADSFRYYGPNGLWKSWTPQQREGRDTWIFWTGGNQKFLRQATHLGAALKLPISVEYYRMLDSRNRPSRFKMLGLVNEPNCAQADAPDPETGLWLDVWKGDPYLRGEKGGGEKGKYDDATYAEGKYPYYPDPAVPKYHAWYGEPTGIVGLRKFRNPGFWGDTPAAGENRKKWQRMRKDADGKSWDLTPYFAAPSKFEPPYLVGFSCAFCHMGFDPTNPPRDPANPRWENLAANLGNQYFREGDLFFARGRIVFGDRGAAKGSRDPYDTKGLGPDSLLYHYAVTQPPGTSETSRISYDFINNPTIINSVINLSHRPTFIEKTPDGKDRVVNHVLADGADSVGLELALLRVWINIGCEGRYWLGNLFNFGTGERQRPLDINELLLTDKVSPERKAELLKKENFGPDLGKDWKEAWRRNPNLVAYLASYGGFSLKKALDRLEDQANAAKDEKEANRLREFVAKWRPDKARLAQGKKVFAEKCVECHSSKLPTYPFDGDDAEHLRKLRESVGQDDFLVNNTLSNDRRYSVALLGVNMARALGTNATDNDIWANFSSLTYKALPPAGTFELSYTLNKDGWLVPKEKFPKEPYKVVAPTGGPSLKADPKAADFRVRFPAPGGGRGYYRSPTLVSMWATAPYLHNNSVGDYWVVKRDANRQVISRERFPNKDGAPALEEIDTSVEGRLLMFQDGVEKLLWPEKRHRSVLRVQQDCYLFDLQPALKDLLPGVLRDWVFKFFADRLSKGVGELVGKAKGLPPDKAGQVRENVRTVLRTELIALRKETFGGGLQALNKRLQAGVEEKLLDRVKPHLPPPLVKPALQRFQAAQAAVLKEIDELLSEDFLKVPHGTPVNLYFNLSAGAIPAALLAHLEYRHDPLRRAEALLRLSDCPDLVEDSGHVFGSELSDEDRRALIEFLKTF